MKKLTAIIFFASLIVAIIWLNSCNLNETNSSKKNIITPFVVSVDSSSTNDVASYLMNSSYMNSESSTPNPSNLSDMNEVTSFTSFNNTSRTNSTSLNPNSVTSSKPNNVFSYSDSTDSSNKEDEALILESMMTAKYSDSPISLRWDNPIDLCTRYDAETVISFSYTVNSIYDADEYIVTCEGESIKLLSSAKCNIKNYSSYKIEFLTPEKGVGKITLTLTAFKDGKTLVDEVHTYLFWSSCDLGVYVSGSEPVPELMMAKAQYDAGEITSLSYYKIIRNQYFEIDLELLGMLQRTASDNPKISPYAAPYVKAIHNSIFDIKSDAKIPTVDETLQKIKNDLGIDFTGEAARKNKISSG